MPTSFIAQFWFGFFTPFRALKLLIKTPKLWPYFIIPMIISGTLYGILFINALAFITLGIQALVAMLPQSLPAWLSSTVVVFGKILSFVLLGILTLFSFTILTNLISSPFNDMLARAVFKVEYKKANLQLPKFQSSSVLRSLLLECKRLFILAWGSIAAMLMGFLPGIQILSIALGCMLLSFEYFGYPIGIFSHQLSDVVAFTKKHLWISLGFGAVLFMSLTVPFSSILLIPLAVIGSTQNYIKLSLNEGTDNYKRT